MQHYEFSDLFSSSSSSSSSSLIISPSHLPCYSSSAVPPTLSLIPPVHIQPYCAHPDTRSIPRSQLRLDPSIQPLPSRACRECGNTIWLQDQVSDKGTEDCEEDLCSL
eukprot:746471-Hanusia_phi.AAC.2